MSEWLTPSRRCLWSPLLSLIGHTVPGSAWAHRSLVNLVDMRLNAAVTTAKLVGEIKQALVMRIFLLSSWRLEFLVVRLIFCGCLVIPPSRSQGCM